MVLDTGEMSLQEGHEDGIYQGYIGIMEKKMEAIIIGYTQGSYRDYGKEAGNYYNRVHIHIYIYIRMYIGVISG